MPKESEIRKKAVEILGKKKFLCWYPAKVKFKQNDIFGIFDLICCQKKTAKIKFIQLTTLSNLSARKKKIKNFFKKNRISQKSQKNSLNIELWGWDKRYKIFKMIKIS